MSRIHGFFGIFSKDRERVDGWVRSYIHHRNLYAKGQGELSFLKAMINAQSLMVTWLFLKNIFPGLPLWLFVAAIPVALVVRVGSYWLLGYWWDRNNYYDRENDWNNERNPIQKAVSETLLDGRGIN